MTEPTADLPPLDVAKTLDGKNLIIIGSTGFVGKVLLSMLLRRYPNVGKVFCLVRPGMGNTAEQRFFGKVAPSPAFDPLREVWGDGFESFMREKVVPIPGDIGRPYVNFSDEQFEEFERAGGIDCLINSAGLVSFQPSLESAVRINAMGPKNVLEAARRCKTKLLHVSTCYVAGRRNGDVWEDEPVVGYFPRHEELRDDDFDAEREIEDCLRIIEQTREMARDRAHISEFRERAAKALEDQRRDPDHEKTLRLAVARERKMWVARKLTDLGMERASHWGWTNTYTYTKSLGEQIILKDQEVVSTIVRPAVVESSVRYPFAGWNEGFNTTAPLVYLVLKGHRQIAAGRDARLDLIPVDHIAAGTIMATAALLADQHEPVYQLGSSDLNGITAARLVELTGLAVRRHYRDLADDGEDVLKNRIRARLEAFPVTYDEFQQRSAPMFRRLAERASRALDERVPRWGAPRLKAWAERAQGELEKVTDFTGQVTDLIDMFKPFNHDFDIGFRCDNIRALHARLTPGDQQSLPWDPQDIDWREYWFGAHFKGLVKWVFPVLDDEFGPTQRMVYTYKDLNELIDAAAKLHRHRVAMRLLPTKDDDAEPVIYTYGRVQEMALQSAGSMRARGIADGDRVMLMSENRPEWGITYFAILKAGATAVPVDSQLSLAEVKNLLRASGAKMLVISDSCAERLLEDEGIALLEGRAFEQLTEQVEQGDSRVDVVEFDDLLVEPSAFPAALQPAGLGSKVASIIYTSGTTGDPKGVMLTHKNLTSMAAKLSTVFKLYRHDGLLSVLPLHHTFEFSAGLLMPLIHGSSITYLDEIDADGLSAAFDEGKITGMVGVPALWKLLHRKIFKTVSERGSIAQRIFERLIAMNQSIRDNSPYGWNLGKLLFWPVHRKLGGRQRLLISGGSALSPEVLKDFHGLGFNIYEGYGMTEASPVLAVMRPQEIPVIGSVGRALPGVTLAIDDPDDGGVGEVKATGPNVMKGYYENEDATRRAIKDGWLHTGDLGRLDEEGNLFIVGRKKDMILGSSGENVYPDELEEQYGDSEFIKEISVVGVPDGDHETIASLVVPDYEQDEMSRAEVQAEVREHMRTVSNRLPLYKRVKVFHLWDHDLPKTSTRKIKRPEVVAELEKLERASAGASAARESSSGTGRSNTAWVRDVLAQVSQRPRAQVMPEIRLDALGFDSLMFTELGVALDAAGVGLPDASVLGDLETVADVERWVREQAGGGRRSASSPQRVVEASSDDEDIYIPAPVVSVGRKGLRFLQRMTYERIFETKVFGAAYVPPFGGYIVAANHASHLDMGLAKHALGESGPLLRAMAAKDYFFDDPVRRAYFENFTNLVPMERFGSLRESLAMACDVIYDGDVLLIFPEGTRSETGVMIDFKGSLGYLALANRCGILPMYLAHTHDAMPKGAALPKQRDIAAHVGPFIPYEALVALTKGRSRSASYRVIASHVEGVVRSLAPDDLVWTLGESGRSSVAESQAKRAAADEPPRDAGDEPEGTVAS